MRAAVLWPSVGVLALALGLLWWWSRPEAPTGPAPGAAARAEGPSDGLADPPAAPDAPAGRPSASDPSEGVFDASARAWANVDLDAVRAALPDNSYWERSAPTDDPELLRRREEERAFWEEQYGKVLSNTASEEEVRDYYAHRQQLSTDAIEFSSHLLGHYGDHLPERDVGLLQLAIKLHMARLEELPRNLSDALERRDAHEQRRREWLAQQEMFEADSGAPKGD